MKYQKQPTTFTKMCRIQQNTLPLCLEWRTSILLTLFLQYAECLMCMKGVCMHKKKITDYIY